MLGKRGRLWGPPLCRRACHGWVHDDKTILSHGGSILFPPINKGFFYRGHCIFLGLYCFVMMLSSSPRIDDNQNHNSGRSLSNLVHGPWFDHGCDNHNIIVHPMHSEEDIVRNILSVHSSNGSMQQQHATNHDDVHCNVHHLSNDTNLLPPYHDNHLHQYCHPPLHGGHTWMMLHASHSHPWFHSSLFCGTPCSSHHHMDHNNNNVPPTIICNGDQQSPEDDNSLRQWIAAIATHDPGIHHHGAHVSRTFCHDTDTCSKSNVPVQHGCSICNESLHHHHQNHVQQHHDCSSYIPQLSHSPPRSSRVFSSYTLQHGASLPDMSCPFHGAPLLFPSTHYHHHHAMMMDDSVQSATSNGDMRSEQPCMAKPCMQAAMTHYKMPLFLPLWWTTSLSRVDHPSKSMIPTMLHDCTRFTMPLLHASSSQMTHPPPPSSLRSDRCSGHTATWCPSSHHPLVPPPTCEHYSMPSFFHAQHVHASKDNISSMMLPSFTNPVTWQCESCDNPCRDDAIEQRGTRYWPPHPPHHCFAQYPLLPPVCHHPWQQHANHRDPLSHVAINDRLCDNNQTGGHDMVVRREQQQIDKDCFCCDVQTMLNRGVAIRALSSPAKSCIPRYILRAFVTCHSHRMSPPTIDPSTTTPPPPIMDAIAAARIPSSTNRGNKHGNNGKTRSLMITSNVYKNNHHLDGDCHCYKIMDHVENNRKKSNNKGASCLLPPHDKKKDHCHDSVHGRASRIKDYTAGCSSLYGIKKYCLCKSSEDYYTCEHNLSRDTISITHVDDGSINDGHHHHRTALPTNNNKKKCPFIHYRDSRTLCGAIVYARFVCRINEYTSQTMELYGRILRKEIQDTKHCDHYVMRVFLRDKMAFMEDCRQAHPWHHGVVNHATDIMDWKHPKSSTCYDSCDNTWQHYQKDMTAIMDRYCGRDDDHRHTKEMEEDRESMDAPSFSSQYESNNTECKVMQSSSSSRNNGTGCASLLIAKETEFLKSILGQQYVHVMCQYAASPHLCHQYHHRDVFINRHHIVYILLPRKSLHKMHHLPNYRGSSTLRRQQCNHDDSGTDSPELEEEND